MGVICGHLINCFAYISPGWQTNWEIYAQQTRRQRHTEKWNASGKQANKETNTICRDISNSCFRNPFRRAFSQIVTNFPRLECQGEANRIQIHIESVFVIPLEILTAKLFWRTHSSLSRSPHYAGWFMLRINILMSSLRGLRNGKNKQPPDVCCIPSGVPMQSIKPYQP